MKKTTNHTQITRSLYTPQLEKDACGTGLIANLNGDKSHQLVLDALSMLSCMEHRGAIGADPKSGDGAGILLQNPHDFFEKKCRELGIELPEFGKYGVGMLFFPKDKNLREQCRILFNDYIDESGFELLGYRKVPVDHDVIGDIPRSVEPKIEQVFVKPKEDLEPVDAQRSKTKYSLRATAGPRKTVRRVQRARRIHTPPMSTCSSCLPSSLTATAIITARLTIRPPSRTFT